MNSIFSKVILFFASILSVLSGPNYIQLGADNLTFDFKTGENFPIYYFLNVQNVGPGTERFEISSDQPWVSARREGTDYNFVELPSQAYINFVLEIRPERLTDGINEAKVNLKVLDIDSLASQELVLDEAEVSIILNKNIIPTSPAPIFTATPKPQIISSISPTAIPEKVIPVLRPLEQLIQSLRSLVQILFRL